MHDVREACTTSRCLGRSEQLGQGHGAQGLRSAVRTGARTGPLRERQDRLTSGYVKAPAPHVIRTRRSRTRYRRRWTRDRSRERGPSGRGVRAGRGTRSGDHRRQRRHADDRTQPKITGRRRRSRSTSWSTDSTTRARFQPGRAPRRPGRRGPPPSRCALQRGDQPARGARGDAWVHGGSVSVGVAVDTPWPPLLMVGDEVRGGAVSTPRIASRSRSRPRPGSSPATTSRGGAVRGGIVRPWPTMIMTRDLSVRRVPGTPDSPPALRSMNRRSRVTMVATATRWSGSVACCSPRTKPRHGRENEVVRYPHLDILRKARSGARAGRRPGKAQWARTA